MTSSPERERESQRPGFPFGSCLFLFRNGTTITAELAEPSGVEMNVLLRACLRYIVLALLLLLLATTVWRCMTYAALCCAGR
jgi:hypothetical protein